LKEAVVIRSDSVHKCHAFQIDSRALAIPLPATERDRCARSKARRLRAFILMPCKHHANYYGIQSLFSMPARAHTLTSIPNVYANARNAIDNIDAAFPLVTHARDRRHKNSLKRMGLYWASFKENVKF